MISHRAHIMQDSSSMFLRHWIHSFLSIKHNMASRFMLCFKAPILLCCTDLQLQGGFDDHNHWYRIRLQCNSCREEDYVSVRLSYELPVARPSRLSGSLPKNITWPDDNRVNYQGLCNRCQNMFWVKMIPGHGEPYSPADYGAMIINEEDYGKMMMFEVWGCTPCGYKLGGGWQVKLDNGKIVQDINLSNGSWYPESSIVEKEAPVDEDEEEEGSEDEVEEDVGSDDEEENEDETPCIKDLAVFFKPLA